MSHRWPATGGQANLGCPGKHPFDFISPWSNIEPCPGTWSTRTSSANGGTILRLVSRRASGQREGLVMAKPFKNLVGKMPLESQKRALKLKEELLRDVTLRELRQALELTQR